MCATEKKKNGNLPLFFLILNLALLLTDTVLEEVHVGGHAVLTVEDDGAHGCVIEGGAEVEDVVVKVAKDLLDKGLGLGHEGLDAVGVLLLEVSLDSLHVLLDVGDVELLGEGGLGESVSRHKVDDLGLGGTVEALSTVVLISVGSNAVVAAGLLSDHLALDDIDAALILDGESVTCELVAGENVNEKLHGW